MTDANHALDQEVQKIEENESRKDGINEADLLILHAAQVAPRLHLIEIDYHLT